jgi:hypothetical protein
MKYFLWSVLGLVVLALVVTALVTGAGKLIRSSCTTGVVIVEGPHGEKIECVCIGGVQAACFEPGP